jgi:hypothetical protein
MVFLLNGVEIRKGMAVELMGGDSLSLACGNWNSSWRLEYAISSRGDSSTE